MYVCAHAWICVCVLVCVPVWVWGVMYVCVCELLCVMLGVWEGWGMGGYVDRDGQARR